MSGAFYRHPDTPELCQGDVIDDIPQFHLASLPLTIIREYTASGKRPALAPYPYPPEEGKTPDAAGKSIKLPPFHVKEGEFLSSFARFGRGIVLNHDCDLVEDDPNYPERPKPEHCWVAVVRPMSSVHEKDRDTIRGNQNYGHFFLPEAHDFHLEEGYADFRQVTCLHPNVVKAIGKRRASFTPLGVGALQAQLLRFLAHRDLQGRNFISAGLMQLAQWFDALPPLSSLRKGKGPRP